jgi:hypothetical protein
LPYRVEILDNALSHCQSFIDAFATNQNASLSNPIFLTLVMCALASQAPNSRSDFTVDQIGGIMSHARPYPPPRDLADLLRDVRVGTISEGAGTNRRAALGVGLRLLSGQPSNGTRKGHRQDIRPGPRGFGGRIALFSRQMH